VFLSGFELGQELGGAAASGVTKQAPGFMHEQANPIFVVLRGAQSKRQCFEYLEGMIKVLVAGAVVNAIANGHQGGLSRGHLAGGLVDRFTGAGGALGTGG